MPVAGMPLPSCASSVLVVVGRFGCDSGLSLICAARVKVLVVGVLRVVCFSRALGLNSRSRATYLT